MTTRLLLGQLVTQLLWRHLTDERGGSKGRGGSKERGGSKGREGVRGGE